MHGGPCQEPLSVLISRSHAVAAAVVVALLVVAGPRAVRAETPLSIADAVRLAVQNNERSLQAPLRVQAAEGQLDRSRAAFVPTLSAQGNTGLQSPSSNQSSTSTSLTLQVPLVNLSAIPLYKQAKYQRDSEHWGAEQDVRQLVFDTARAFLTAIAAEHVLTAAKSRLSRAKATQDNAAHRAAAQLSSTNDVTRAALDTSNAAATVATAQGNVTNAYLQLAFLVGQPVTDPLQVPETTTKAAQAAVPKLDDMIRQAEGLRPDLRSADAKTASLRQSAEEPQYRLLPTLNAQGQVKQAAGTPAGDTGRSEVVQLALVWPIFDGGTRYGDRKARVAQAESQDLGARLLRRSIATDVRVAVSSLQAAREAYAIAVESVKIALRNTQETTVLYQQGIARAIEVSDANATRFDAEVSLANAQLNMEQAYVQLRFALGLDPAGTQELAYPSPKPVPGSIP